MLYRIIQTFKMIYKKIIAVKDILKIKNKLILNVFLIGIIPVNKIYFS